MTPTKLFGLCLTMTVGLPLFSSCQPSARDATSRAPAAYQPTKAETLVTEYLVSEVLKDNLIGIDLKRSISVYLPPGYHTSVKTYPVIYYFHSINWSNDRMFKEGNAVKPLLDRAIFDGVINEFILVAANYSSPTMGSWYENSSTSGMWLDYTIEEVLPYVDSHFRTIRHRDSRGLAGEFLGGYGACRFDGVPEADVALQAHVPINSNISFELAGLNRLMEATT